MKHRIKGKKLNRTSSHRKALLKNMSQALIKHESFGKASKSIGLTQSALSQNIKKLENHYGVKFFQRENGKTKPTVYGEMLLSLTDEIVDIEEKIINQISLINNSVLNNSLSEDVVREIQ